MLFCSCYFHSAIDKEMKQEANNLPSVTQLINDGKALIKVSLPLPPGLLISFTAALDNMVNQQLKQKH